MALGVPISVIRGSDTAPENTIFNQLYFNHSCDRELGSLAHSIVDYQILIVGMLWWLRYSRSKIAKIVFFGVVSDLTKTLA